MSACEFLEKPKRLRTGGNGGNVPRCKSPKVVSPSDSTVLDDYIDRTSFRLLICRPDRNALGHPLAGSYLWNRYEEDIIDSLQYGPSANPRIRVRSPRLTRQRDFPPQRIQRMLLEDEGESEDQSLGGGESGSRVYHYRWVFFG